MQRYIFFGLQLVLVLGLYALPQRRQAPPRIRIPFGLDELPQDLIRDFRPEVATLGRQLFSDPILSVDHKTSCASCHQPEHGFASTERLPMGSLGRHALRNAPTLLNRAYGKTFSWDGKASELETQVLLPIENPNEMALPLEQALARLAADAEYAKRFQKLFGREPRKDDLALALASYVRSLLTGDSVIDRFHAGQEVELAPAEKAGMWIFESKGGCWQCHSGSNFSDEGFHNSGVGVVDGRPEPGRAAVTGKRRDKGAFKTPTLRGLPATAPYMHDGSLATLEAVVAFYRRGGNANPGIDPRLKPLDLSDQEAGFLVAFLRALSRHPDPQGLPKRGQQKPSRKRR